MSANAAISAGPYIVNPFEQGIPDARFFDVSPFNVPATASPLLTSLDVVPHHFGVSCVLFLVFDMVSISETTVVQKHSHNQTCAHIHGRREPIWDHTIARTTMVESMFVPLVGYIWFPSPTLATLTSYHAIWYV